MTTVYVGYSLRPLPFVANEEAVVVEPSFFEELDLDMEVTAHPILDFRNRLEKYQGKHPFVVIRLLKLVRLGQREGADMVFWD